MALTFQDLRVGDVIRTSSARTGIIGPIVDQTPAMITRTIRWITHESPGMVGELHPGGCTKRKTTAVTTILPTRCFCGYSSMDTGSLYAHFADHA
jgi:hypothetical protein